MSAAFLTAEWRRLVMVNYRVQGDRYNAAGMAMVGL